MKNYSKIKIGDDFLKSIISKDERMENILRQLTDSEKSYNLYRNVLNGKL